MRRYAESYLLYTLGVEGLDRTQERWKGLKSLNEKEGLSMPHFLWKVEAGALLMDQWQRELMCVCVGGVIESRKNLIRTHTWDSEELIISLSIRLMQWSKIVVPCTALPCTSQEHGDSWGGGIQVISSWKIDLEVFVLTCKETYQGTSPFQAWKRWPWWSFA